MGNFVLDLLRNVGSTQTNQSGGGIGGILKMFSVFKNSANPEETLSKLATQNEQVSGIVDMVKNQYNGDAKAAFYAKAKELGIDPEDVLSLLK